VYSKEAYAPFGEVYNEAGSADRSFTGQDQNVVTGSGGTGVYDFLFRKYDPSAGRWLSPDPAGWSAVDQAIPQSLNRYAYVYNNPLRFIDPSGLKPIPCPDGGTLGGQSGAGSENEDEGSFVIQACDDGQPVDSDPGPPSDCSLDPQCNANYNGAQLLLLPSPPQVPPLVQNALNWVIDKLTELTPLKKSVKYVEKEIDCEVGILRDDTQQLKNYINREGGSVNIKTNFAECIEKGILDPMANPLQSY
jgi:RHS repeat-associated protein